MSDVTASNLPEQGPAMPRLLGCLLALVAMPSGLGTAKAAESDFPWASEARRLVPSGWVGGQVVGYDAARRVGTIAAYPVKDGDPTTPGMALQVMIDAGGHPIPSSSTFRQKASTETVYFRTAGGSAVQAAFEPSPGLPPGTTPCSFAGWTHDLDPKGVNVRSEPSARGRPVGVL